MTTLTTLEFHALFIVPPLVLLGLAAGAVRWRSTASLPAVSEVRPEAVTVVVAIAIVYTTPWDNYLIELGVWTYGEGRIADVIWRAPIEEYLFIVLQPVLAGLWLHWWTAEAPPADGSVPTSARTAAGVVAALLVGVAGVAAVLASPATLYLGAILAWAAPVLALQWAVGWPYLVRRWRAVLVGVAGPTLYLVVVRVAIEAGVWLLSDTYITGVAILGLPVEEGLFFLTTSLFVVQALLLYPLVRRRWL